MQETKPAKTPWTKAQRASLSAILHPNSNDPPDFILSADEAWKRTGFGDLPAKWTKEREEEVAARARESHTDATTPLIAYFVATRGVEGALATMTAAWKADRRFLGYTEFRRYVMAADDATFARVREFLLAGWEEADWRAKIARAFVLSRDPTIGRAFFESRPQEPMHISGPLMIAVGDPAIAARVLEAATGGTFSFPECFDLVETYGNAAAPLLEAVLGRFEGKGTARKPIEQALKLAQALPATAANPAPVVVSKTGPTFPQEADYGGQNVVVAGNFDLPEDIVAARLIARGLWASAKTPTKQTKAYFEGAGAKSDLRAKAQKAGVPVFGVDDLRKLIATPLFEFRERVTHEIKRELESPITNVTTWYVGPPATEAQLAAAEKAFGVPLDPALRALYSQCDGIQFRCDEASNAEVQKLAPVKRTWGEVGSSMATLGVGTGALSILPIDELVASRSFGKRPSDGRGRTVQLGRRKVDLERFLENLYVFDFWHDFYPVGLHVDRERGEYEIVIGDDHGAVWDDPDVESVESYLERPIGSRWVEREHGKRRFARPLSG